jgi:hypothetical protein
MYLKGVVVCLFFMTGGLSWALNNGLDEDVQSFEQDKIILGSQQVNNLTL